MMFTKAIRYAFSGVMALLFPRTCPVCGMLLEGEDDKHICLRCMQRLKRTEQAVERGNMTEDLFKDEKRFVKGGAFLFYSHGDDNMHNIVRLFKYSRQPMVAYDIAREGAVEWLQTDFFDDIDIIVPVPLHKRRLRQRGYNQSYYIARAIADTIGVPVDTEHLLRRRNNPQQALLKGEQRTENVKDLFALTDPMLFARKHVLLVDDILTTGSTMRSCIRAFDECRGCKVSVFALAKAK